jgi:hypothetical protein
MFEFKRTWDEMPEQYEVYSGQTQVAFMKLQNGVVEVYEPNEDGEAILYADLGGRNWGKFATDAEREYWFDVASQLIFYRIASTLGKRFEEFLENIKKAFETLKESEDE